MIDFVFILLIAGSGIGLLLLSEILIADGLLRLIGRLLGIGIILASLIWLTQWVFDGGLIS